MASGTLVAAAVAATLILASPGASAAALGAVTVQSALGEPLRAEIQIPQLSSEEASTFSARMGSPGAFAGAGISYNSDLSSALVTLQRRSNGEAYLRITTDRPINDPVLGIVIEADWASGQVTRDYTMLLDPPQRVETEAAAPQSAAPAPTPAPPATRAPAAAAPQAPRVGQAEQVQPGRTAAAQKKSTPADVTRAPRLSTPSGAVTIQRGDTASQIAIAHGLQGVSLDQMLLAMLRANPEAFIRGNVNLIRAGAVIQMPSAEDARSVSRADARRMVVAQTEDFQAYRRGLAQNVQATQATPGNQAVEGQVETQVAETQKPAAETDRLEVSKGGTDAETATKAAQARQSQDQAERVAELDRNISELSELESQLSDEPDEASPAADDTAADAEPAELEVVPEPEASADDAAAADSSAVSDDSATTDEDAATTDDSAASADEDTAADASATDASAADESGDSAASDDAQEAGTDAAQAGAASSDTGTERATEDAAAPAAAPEAESPDSKLAIPASVPAEQPASLLDQVSEYRWPIIAILVALLALLGIGRSRRRKQADPLAADDTPAEQSFTKTTTKPAEAEAPTPDLGDDDNDDAQATKPDPLADAEDDEDISAEALSSAFADSAFSLSATEAGADADGDLVREADIYTEYGHDEKAEELLNEALQAEPGRTEIYEKLAQVYLRRNDKQALAALSARAAAAPVQAEAAWQAVAAVGRKLEPSNPRYQPRTADKATDETPAPAAPGDDGAPLSTSLDAPYNHQMYWAETEKGDAETLNEDADKEDNRYSPTTLDFDLNFEATNLGERKGPSVVGAGTLTSEDLQGAGGTQDPVEHTPGTHEETLDLDIDFSASGRAGLPQDDLPHADPDLDNQEKPRDEPQPESADLSRLMEFDLGADAEPTAAPAGESTLMDFDLSPDAPHAPAPAADSTLMEFDLGSSDTDTPKAAAESTLMDFDLGDTDTDGVDTPAPAADSTLMDFNLDADASSEEAQPAGDSALMDFDLGQPDSGADAADASDDPLATKLALAEEFEAIGDREGARSMAQEVAELATGALKEKAEAFLNSLGGAQ